jgi:hypothetical protein
MRLWRSVVRAGVTHFLATDYGSLCRAQRASAALRAICLRSSAVSFAALAFPPLRPPLRPLTCAGVSGTLGPVDSRTIRCAIWLRSAMWGS